MKAFTFCICLAFLGLSTAMNQPVTLSLWDENVPNRIDSGKSEVHERGDFLWITHVQVPTLEVYLPSKANSTGMGVVVCPGGGYAGLAYDWEGTDIAKWYNSLGIAAFVLKYRLPESSSNKTPHLSPLMDAQRAIRMVRANAKQWNVTPYKIGIMGFSAGGHLAASLSVHYDQDLGFERDSIDQESARPDFAILVYPVITFSSEKMHAGSMKNLLGESPDPELIAHFSPELQATAQTPPTFLIHAGDDDGVPVENSLLMYQALKDKGIPVEMHIYPEGGHGFSLAKGKGYLQTWIDRCEDWVTSLDLQGE